MMKRHNPWDYVVGALVTGLVIVGLAACGASSESPAGDTSGVYNLKVEFGTTWRDCVRLYDHDMECDFTHEATAP